MAGVVPQWDGNTPSPGLDGDGQRAPSEVRPVPRLPGAEQGPELTFRDSVSASKEEEVHAIL